MQENKQDVNIVETLRLKSEEADMQQYLKSTMNGYTKKSVHEYLNILRKQQQSTADTFSQNQQVLFEEKENLKKDNEALKTRLSQVESEYRSLSEVPPKKESAHIENPAKDNSALNDDFFALKEELNMFINDNSQLETQIRQKEGVISELSLKLEESGREKLALSKKLEEAQANNLDEKRRFETQIGQKEGVISELSLKLEESGREKLKLSEKLEEAQSEYLEEKCRIETQIGQKEGVISELSLKLEESGRDKLELSEKLEDAQAEYLEEKRRIETQIRQKDNVISKLENKLEKSDEERLALAEQLEEELEKCRKEKQQLEVRIEQKENIMKDFSLKLEESGREKRELLEMLKEERKKFSNEMHQLEMQVEQTDSSIKDSLFRLEQSERERVSLKDKLKADMLETKKFQEMISRLSATIKQQDGELRHLKSQVSDGRLSELNEKVGDLSLQLSTQSKVLANYDSENSLKSQIIRTMSQEKETLKQSLSRLVKHIDEVNAQNQKLIFANTTLSEQLESEYKKYIALVQEKPFLMDDPSASRGWGETISDITMLELHNQINSEKISTVYKSSYQSDTNQPCISKQDITKCTEQTSHIIARSVSCKTSK